jgi:hypothetical protein
VLFLGNDTDPPVAIDVDFSKPLVLGLGFVEPAPAMVVQMVTGKL